MALTAKQVRFVAEYLKDLNATQAAIRAGYSQRTAGEIGYENLKKPEVAAAITAAQSQRSERTGITQDRVLNELAAVGFSDVTSYEVDDTGRLVVRPDAPEGARRAVASVKRKARVSLGDRGRGVEDVDTEIKLWNKVEALRLLGNHLGMFADSLNVNIGPVEVTEVVVHDSSEVKAAVDAHPEATPLPK